MDAAEDERRRLRDGEGGLPLHPAPARNAATMRGVSTTGSAGLGDGRRRKFVRRGYLSPRRADSQVGTGVTPAEPEQGPGSLRVTAGENREDVARAGRKTWRPGRSSYPLCDPSSTVEAPVVDRSTSGRGL